MVKQTKIVVDLEDIKSLRLKCRECEGVVIIPVDNGYKVPVQCPCCGEQWEAWGKDKADTVASHIHAALRLTHRRNADTFSVQLEIDEEVTD